MIRIKDSMNHKDYSDNPVGTSYPIKPKGRQRILLNKLPPESVDPANYFMVTRLAVEVKWPEPVLKQDVMPIDLIKRFRVKLNGYLGNVISKNELLIHNLEHSISPSLDRVEIPLDTTGLILNRKDPDTDENGEDTNNELYVELEVDKKLAKVATSMRLIVQMIGKRFPPVEPFRYLQRNFLGSETVPTAKGWVPINADGLVTRLHLVSTSPFIVTRLCHDTNAFSVKSTCKKIDDNLYWNLLQYDTPLNFGRFKTNRVYLEKQGDAVDEELSVSVYSERIGHNFIGRWPLEEAVDG